MSSIAGSQTEASESTLRIQTRLLRSPAGGPLQSVEFVGHERTSWMEFRPTKAGRTFSANERTPSRKSSDDEQAAVASAASGASSEREMSAAVPWAITASTTRFEARWVSGARWAIVSTMAAMWSVWSAAGTTSSTKPIRSAREASIASAVNSNRLACEGPTAATRRRVASGG